MQYINIQYYESFLTHILNKNYTESLNILYSASTNEGYSIQDILFYFYYYVRTHTTINDFLKYELIKIITNILQL